MGKGPGCRPGGGWGRLDCKKELMDKKLKYLHTVLKNYCPPTCFFLNIGKAFFFQLITGKRELTGNYDLYITNGVALLSSSQSSLS